MQTALLSQLSVPAAQGLVLIGSEQFLPLHPGRQLQA
jgi:hypothetical protein